MTVDTRGTKLRHERISDIGNLTFEISWNDEQDVDRSSANGDVLLGGIPTTRCWYITSSIAQNKQW